MNKISRVVKVTMASSDDESGTLPSEISDYYFEDNNDELISFAELPLISVDAETESLEGNQKEIGLRGKADNGLQTIFEQATAWKFDISYAKPEIMVLTKKKNWIKLQKPRKSYEDTIRKILITVHCLIFVKRNREASVKALWDHLSKHFRFHRDIFFKLCFILFIVRLISNNFVRLLARMTPSLLRMI